MSIRTQTKENSYVLDKKANSEWTTNRHTLNPSVIRRPGGYGGASIPDPIPNSAVNHPSANGTSS